LSGDDDICELRREYYRRPALAVQRSIRDAASNLAVLGCSL